MFSVFKLLDNRKIFLDSKCTFLQLKDSSEEELREGVAARAQVMLLY